MSDLIDSFIKDADRLGGLGVASVWAFFTMVLLSYIVWGLKNQKQGEKNNFEMRIKDAETDSAVANALQKMADQIKELRLKIKCLGGRDD